MADPFVLKRLTILVFLSLFLFLLGNNIITLTDPDEVFYSLSVKEMNTQGAWMTPFIFGQPQFEKPIFTYWLLKLSFLNFGMSPFSARFYAGLFGMLGVIAVYLLGLLGFKDEQKAFFSALALMTGALYFAMSKTVFTDMVFTVFILYALLSFYWAYVRPQFKAWAVLGFFIFSGFAVLTKGPLGLLIPASISFLFLLYRRDVRFLFNACFLYGFIVFLVIALPWYGLMLHKYGRAFIDEFFINDHWRRLLEAEHRSNDSWYFYPVTMIGGIFPWSLFLLVALKGTFQRLKGKLDVFEYFIMAWILLVFCVFQVAHSKLASYILPVFPALALLCGNYLGESIKSSQGTQKVRRLAVVLSISLCVFAVLLNVLFPVYHKYISSRLPVYWLSGSIFTLGGISLCMMLKGYIKAGIYVIACIWLCFLATIPMIKADLEPHISSYEATQYLPGTIAKDAKILCSKPYARGVRYYMDHEVAVVSLGGGSYFSPHPVRMLNTENELREFLLQQKLSYAIVKKGDYESFQRLDKKEFQVMTLKRLGKNYVLKILVNKG